MGHPEGVSEPPKREEGETVEVPVPAVVRDGEGDEDGETLGPEVAVE